MIQRVLSILITGWCAVAGLSAQTFEFRNSGTPVEDGATVTFVSHKSLFTQETICETVSLLSLCNLTDEKIACTINLRVEENSMGGTGTQCCMGGNCRAVTGSSLSFAFELDGNAVEGTMYDAVPKTDGVMRTKFTATSTTGETHYVYILFTHGDVSGIDDVSLSGGDALVDVYSLDGSLRCSKCNADELRSLPRGMYVLRSADGTTRKLMLGR